MKNIILYISILCALFITPATAPFLGIKMVGTAAYGLFILFFILYIAFKYQYIKSKNTKIESYILIIFSLYCISKAINNNWDSIQIAFFFVAAPMFISVVLQIQRAEVKKKSNNIILFFFFLECILAIYEKINNVNIFPYTEKDSTINIEIQDWEFRSSALLGHPLHNALCIATILGFILISYFSLSFKITSIILGYIAILCFNARGAIITTSIVIIYYLYLLQKHNKKNIYFRLIFIVLASLGLYGIYYLLNETSLGGRLIHEESLFDASAQTRLDVYKAFDYIKGYDLWTGNQKLYLAITDKLNAGGIENSIVVILLNYGILFGIPLLFCLYKYVSKQIKAQEASQKIILVISFIFTGLMNNSLALDTPWVIFIICIHTFPYTIIKKTVPIFKTIKESREALLNKYIY